MMEAAESNPRKISIVAKRTSALANHGNLTGHTQRNARLGKYMRQGCGFQESGGARVVATACAITICLMSVAPASDASGAVAKPRPDPVPLWKAFPLEPTSGSPRASPPRPSEAPALPASVIRTPSSTPDPLQLALLISAGVGVLVAILLLSRLVVAAGPVAGVAGIHGRHRGSRSSGSAFGSGKRLLGRATLAPLRATASFARVLGEQTVGRRENPGKLGDESNAARPATSAGAKSAPTGAAPARVADRIAAYGLGTAVGSVEKDRSRAAADPIAAEATRSAREEPAPHRLDVPLIMSALLRAALREHGADVSFYAVGIALACALGWLVAHLGS
jgi:hypothetical protein